MVGPLVFFSRKQISESTNPSYKSSFHSFHARHLEISWDFGLGNHHMFCHQHFFRRWWVMSCFFFLSHKSQIRRIYNILRLDISTSYLQAICSPFEGSSTLDFFTVKGSSPPKPPVASTADTLTNCPWFTKEYHFSHGIIAKVPGPGTLEVN